MQKIVGLAWLCGRVQESCVKQNDAEHVGIDAGDGLLVGTRVIKIGDSWRRKNQWRYTIIANIGEHLVTLVSNQVPIRHAEELVTGSEQRLVVGVVCNISHSVGHDDRGKLQKLLKKNSK